jgi:hypothetical protein
MGKSNHSCNVGLDSRCQDLDGEIRRKRGDTRVDTLRGIYGETFASGYRGDMKLENLLDREGASSLSELLAQRKR